MSKIANVDLDGVVYPFHTAVTRLAETWLGHVKYPAASPYARRPTPLPTPRSWALWEEWGMTSNEYFEEFWPWAVEHGVFNQTLPPVPGAREGIEQLHDLGFEIRFVTHKPTQGGQFKHHAIRDCVQWLSWNNIEYDSIIFDGHKARYHADVVIDDNPDMRWTQEGALNLLFDQPWNQQPPDTSSLWFRLRGWEDLKLFA